MAKMIILEFIDPMKFISIVCIAASSFLAFGCGSSSSNMTDSNSVAATNANVTNTSNVVPIMPVNGTLNDANAANAAGANQQAKVVTPPANAKPMTFPAPDDSEYSSSMNSSGQAIETRVFRNDPQIAKVERLWKNVNDKVITIYLKNGKKVNVPGDKLAEIKSVPITTFYDAAGLKPTQAAAKTSPAGKKDEKPKQ